MPVLGYSAVGGTNFQWNNWFSVRFQATEDGTFTDLNAYFALTGSGNYKLCIWADNGSGQPGALLFQSSADTVGTTASLKTRPCSYSFTNGQILHLGIVADDWFILYGDTGITNQFSEFSQDYTSYPTPPNPPTTANQYDIVTTIYGNYTANGATDTSKMLLFF